MLEHAETAVPYVVTLAEETEQLGCDGWSRVQSGETFHQRLHWVEVIAIDGQTVVPVLSEQQCHRMHQFPPLLRRQLSPRLWQQ